MRTLIFAKRSFFLLHFYSQYAFEEIKWTFVNFLQKIIFHCRQTITVVHNMYLTLSLMKAIWEIEDSFLLIHFAAF